MGLSREHGGGLHTEARLLHDFLGFFMLGHERKGKKPESFVWSLAFRAWGLTTGMGTAEWLGFMWGATTYEL